MDRTLARLLMLALVGILAFPALSAAQITRGAVSGTVRDATGAVVPGASVTVTNMDTNISRSVVTDAQGFFRVPGPRARPLRCQGRAQRLLDRRVQGRPPGVGQRGHDQPRAEGGRRRRGPHRGRPGRVHRAQQDEPDRSARPPWPAQVVELPLSARPRRQQPDRHGAERQPRQRPGHLRRQRPALAQQQLHDRRLGQQRHQRHHRDDAARAGGGGRVPGADERLQRRVRAQQRRPGQRHHQVRHEHVPRRGVGLLPHEQPGLAHEPREGPATSRSRPSSRATRSAPASAGRSSRTGPSSSCSTSTTPIDPAASPGGTVRIPTQSGFAALAGVPLRAGQPASSRQAVLDRLSFLNDVYAQNPSFRNLNTQLVNGVPIETGQTNVNITQPSTYHYFMGRIDHRLTDSDNLTLRYYYNKRRTPTRSATCSSGRPSRAARTSRTPTWPRATPTSSGRAS